MRAFAAASCRRLFVVWIHRRTHTTSTATVTDRECADWCEGGLSVLCAQRCSSADLRRNVYLFKCRWPLCQVQVIDFWPFVFLPWEMPGVLDGYHFWDYSLLTLEMVVCENPRSSEVFKQPIWHQQQCHSNHLFPDAFTNSADYLDHA